MNESPVRRGARRLATGGLVAVAALGMTAVVAPSTAQAESHNDPGTCTHVSHSYVYRGKYADTVAITVKFRNNGDRGTNCRIDIAYAPDSPCMYIAAGQDKSTTLYRYATSVYRSMYHC